MGDGYVYSKYSLNGPETAVAVVGVAAAVYYGGSAVLSALAALASAWAGSGAPLPA